MADLNIQLILKLVDRATAPARRVTEALGRIGGDRFARSAERANAGAIRLARGLGTISGAATNAVFSVQGLLAAAGLGAVGASFVNTAAEFERYNVQLTALEGSSDKARTAMAWIDSFAVKTPLQMDEVVNAYARLRAFGIDPTNGSLQAMVDTMAANGGSAEMLDGMVLALGKSWSKGKLQGEEALMMLEKGVPVYDLLAEKMGKTSEQIIEMISAGQIGRDEMTLLFEALGEANAGASDAMSKTWTGIMSNIGDQWSRFQRSVMSAGLFDYLKNKLQSFLDLLNDMAADGRLQAWAEQLSANVIWAIEGLWQFGAQMVEVFRAVWPYINSAADAVGGFANAAGILIGLSFAKSLYDIASGLSKIASAALANPVIALLAGIAALGYLAYRNWDWIVSIWDSANKAVGDFYTRLSNLTFDEAVQKNREAFEGLFKYITGQSFSEVNTNIRNAFGIDLYQLGVDMMNSFWRGIEFVLDQFTKLVKTRLADMIPDMPDWMKNGSIGGDSGYSGMGGAMDDSAAFAAPDGARALGGPVRKGRMYRTNEEGDEVFRPSSDGTIISTRQLRAAGRGGAPRSFSVGGITINAAPGMNAADIAREVRRQLAAMASEQGFALHDGGIAHA